MLHVIVIVADKYNFVLLSRKASIANKGFLSCRFSNML